MADTDQGQDMQSRREERSYQEYAAARDAQDAQQELNLETPIGKLRAKGIRVSDLIGLLTLVLCGAVLFFVLRSYDSLAIQQDITRKRYGELNEILKNQVQSQKLMTCIISMPQERREKEYSQQNSFCRIMAGN